MKRNLIGLINSTIIIFSLLLSPLNYSYISVQAAPLGASPLNDPWYMHVNVNPPFPYTYSGDNTEGTTSAYDPYLSCVSPTEQGLGSVWFRYFPASDGTLTVDTIGSTTDTVLGIWNSVTDPQVPSDWTAASTDPLDSCNDDYPTLGTASQIEIPVESSKNYFIEVVTARNSQGEYTLNVNLTPDEPIALNSFTLKNPATSPTNSDILVFLATFSKPVTGVDIADFEVNSTSTATVTSVDQVTTSSYDITISGGDLAAFNGTVNLNLSGSQDITDLALNPLPAAEPLTDETYTVDSTIPVCYVKWDASGANDGTSWADAFNDLQSALVSSPCTEIWVAAGKYTPGILNTDTFQLVNGVDLYGGFDGTENSLNERDPGGNPTILSGDIDSNDSQTPIITDITTVTGNNGNSFHVVSGATSAILDGFTITAGYAFGPNPRDKGAGMYNKDSDPIITNISFIGNYSDDFAGGMYNDNSDPKLTNVTFSDNQAQNYGGGMANRFTSSPTLINVTFSGNTSLWNGGGMLNNDSTPALTNVTFYGNSSGSGGGMDNGNSNPTINNTIFWGNVASSGAQINNSTSTPVLSDSVIQDGCPEGSTCTNIISADPLLGVLGIYGGNTQTIPLLTGSSAIDALVTGTNGCGTTITFDQRGMSRPQGTGCDIGAYEAEPEPTPTPEFTATNTLIPTDTATATLFPTDTATATLFPSDTSTATLAPTDTETATLVPTETTTLVPTETTTLVPTSTTTATMTPSITNTLLPTSTMRPTATPRPLYAYDLLHSGNFGSLTTSNCRAIGYAQKVNSGTGTVYIRIYVDDVLVAGKYTAKGGGINFDLTTLPGNPITTDIEHTIRLMAVLENGQPYDLINPITHQPGGSLICSSSVATATPTNTSPAPTNTPIGPTSTASATRTNTSTPLPSNTPGATATPRPLYAYNLVHNGTFGSQTAANCRAIGYAKKVSGGTGTVYIRIYVDNVLVGGKFTSSGGEINFDLLALPGNPFTLGTEHSVRLMAILENGQPYNLINPSSGLAGGMLSCSAPTATATLTSTVEIPTNTPDGPTSTASATQTNTSIPLPTNTPGITATATPRPLYPYYLVHSGNFGSQSLANCRATGYAQKVNSGTGTVYIRIYVDDVLVAGKYTAKGGEINFDLLALPGNPFTTGVEHKVKLMAILENGQPYNLTNPITHQPGGLLTCQ